MIKEEKKLSPHSFDVYRRDVERFLRFLKTLRRETPEEVTRGDILSYLVNLNEEGLALSSVRRSLIVLKGWCRFLVAKGYREDDPSSLLELPRQWRQFPEIFSYREIDQLLGQPDKTTPIGLRDAAILETLYATGLTISELVTLTFDQLHVDPPSLRVGRSERSRMIPVGEVALDVLTDYLKNVRPGFLKDFSGPWLFLTLRGRQLSRQEVWRLFKKYSKRGELRRPINSRTLRHSCAAHLLQGGADIRSVQRMLGHRNLSTTQIYSYLLAGSSKKPLRNST